HCLEICLLPGLYPHGHNLVGCFLYDRISHPPGYGLHVFHLSGVGDFIHHLLRTHHHGQRADLPFRRTPAQAAHAEGGATGSFRGGECVTSSSFETIRSKRPWHSAFEGHLRKLMLTKEGVLWETFSFTSRCHSMG